MYENIGDEPDSASPPGGYKDRNEEQGMPLWFPFT